MDKSQAMKVMAESHRETVEELGQEINRLRDVIKGNKIIFDIASDELKILEKENKRLRETLQSVKWKLGATHYNEYRTRYFRTELFHEVNKALEGDPHESS